MTFAEALIAVRALEGAADAQAFFGAARRVAGECPGIVDAAALVAAINKCREQFVTDGDFLFDDSCVCHGFHFPLRHSL